MADNNQDLRDLLRDPRETLDLELKQWINPKHPEGIAKIAKGCIALRNNNGGRIVIGVRDDGQLDKDNAPSDARTAFHIDEIQAIVSKYSAEAFGIDVQFAEIDGQAYPIITVPSGVRTPVAAKADLPGGPGGKPWIRENAVYVRSLNSNNIASSTEARRGDWDRVTRICFDNREADIGGFVRRHLAALNLETLLSLLPTFSAGINRPTLADQILTELNRGHERFAAAAQRRRLTVPRMGFRESIILIDGEFQQQSPTAAFRDRLLSNAPSHTGWPPFVNLSGTETFSPYLLDQGWEALLDELEPARAFFGPHLDFWRIDPKGIFYHLRGLEDDLVAHRGLAPHTVLDFLLQISRTAEVISTGLSFGRSLGCDETKTSIVFGFRWTQLAGRQLVSWVEPMRFFRSAGVAVQDQIVTNVVVPLETPITAIAPHVENAVRDLFVLFDGREFDSRVIEDIVKQTIERRM